MKKSKLVLALAAASMLPSVAFSAAPVAFGSGWALNSGTQAIDFTCPVTHTCDSAPIADNNFLQVQMTDTATGTVYFRTIVATSTTGAGGNDVFNNESFVVSGAGGSTGGIAASQTLNSASANAGTLTSGTVLAVGSFNNGTENQVDLTQGIWDGTNATTSEFHSGFVYAKDSAGANGTTTLDQQIATTANDFTDRFNYSQERILASDTVVSTTLDIVSGVQINALPGGSVNDQGFTYSLREGTAVAAGGNAALSTGTTTWVAGDKVSHVLVGQSVDLAGSFGYERVSNETNPLAVVENNEFSLSNQGPFATFSTDPFGALAGPTTTSVSTAPAVP
jgi:hypothetical protein